MLRLHNWRTLSRVAKGVEPGAESSVVKLQWSAMSQCMAEASMEVVGESAPLYFGADTPGAGQWQRQLLWSKAASIAGGTSEVQRSIIAERMLGLAKG